MAWWLATIYWTLVGLADASDAYFVRPGPVPRALAEVFTAAMLAALTCVPVTVAVFALAARFPMTPGELRRSLPALGVGCAAFIVVRAATIFALDPFAHFYDRPPAFGAVLTHSFFNNVFVYWLGVGVAHAVHLARRESERQIARSALEAELTQAQLSLLQARLEPHFLFNTLHSVSELVHVDADAAERMIVRLSELLRQVLEGEAAPMVTLDEELRGLGPYVEIEKVRLGERLTVRYDVDGEARAAVLPRMLLQPIVENAVRHGVARLPASAAPGRVTVTARREGAVLRIEVSDNGVGLAGDGASAADRATRETRESRGRGVGVGTTRARIHRMYGEAYGLELLPREGGGATTTLTLPFTTALTTEVAHAR